MINLIHIPDEFLPRSVYQAGEELTESIVNDFGEDELSRYRLVNRKMALTTYERTLQTAIIPPYVAHIDSLWSNTFRSPYLLCIAAAFTSSIVLDFMVKTIGKLNLHTSVLDILPLETDAPGEMIARILRLNCLSVHYGPLWETMYSSDFNLDHWASSDQRLGPWSKMSPSWERRVAFRIPFERRQALIELDVLSASILRLSLDELIAIYRVQFPVLQKNERRLLFDQRGVHVPVRTRHGELVVDEEHPDFPDMVPPFTPVDREADYREAWAHFSKRVKDER